MRIIKLSPEDSDMRTISDVDNYFRVKLPSRDPMGQFFLTKSKISKDGMFPGEMLVFSYNKSIVYTARAASERRATEGPKAAAFPYYFCVDVDSIKPASVDLQDLERQLHVSKAHDKNIVQTRAWVPIKKTLDNEAALSEIWNSLREGVSTIIDKPADMKFEDTLSAEELPSGHTYSEGALSRITVNAYERKSVARAACLEHHGYACAACGVILSEIYGEVAKDFIHVHHLVPLSEVEEGYEVDPIKDLRPVCPDCHAIIHRTDPPMTIEAVADLVERHG